MIIVRTYLREHAFVRTYMHLSVSKIEVLFTLILYDEKKSAQYILFDWPYILLSIRVYIFDQVPIVRTYVRTRQQLAIAFKCTTTTTRSYRSPLATKRKYICLCVRMCCCLLYTSPSPRD